MGAQLSSWPSSIFGSVNFPETDLDTRGKWIATGSIPADFKLSQALIAMPWTEKDSFASEASGVNQ